MRNIMWPGTRLEVSSRTKATDELRSRLHGPKCPAGEVRGLKPYSPHLAMPCARAARHGGRGISLLFALRGGTIE